MTALSGIIRLKGEEMEPSSLFAEKLRLWRSQNGEAGRLTQDELAALLDVSVDAIGKYERSLSYIRGDLEPRLSERLGWSRDEIIACREDWFARQNSLTGSRYRLLDQRVVDEVYGGSWHRTAVASLDLANDVLQDLPEELAPNADVFVPFYEQFPENWGAVFEGDRMVAKWGCAFLLPDDETRFRRGELEESNLTVDRHRQAVLPGHYYGYCPILAIRGGAQGASAMLLSSFVRFLETLADRGVLLHGIGTVSVSPAGAQLCRDFNMDMIGRYKSDPAFELWDLPGRKIATSIFSRKSPKVAKAYGAAFL